MRRYTVGIGAREFVVDVHELDADRFEVSVGEERFEVTLQGEEDLPDAGGAPAAAVSASAPRRAAAAPRVARPRAAPAGLSAQAAPMPGVILELHVKSGDRVERGQPLAVLDAMKMHNLIGATRAGLIVEVCVEPGQAVGHGDAIVRFGD